jgi:hypothetical protein
MLDKKGLSFKLIFDSNKKGSLLSLKIGINKLSSYANGFIMFLTLFLSYFDSGDFVSVVGGGDLDIFLLFLE